MKMDLSYMHTVCTYNENLHPDCAPSEAKDVSEGCRP